MAKSQITISKTDLYRFAAANEACNGGLETLANVRAATAEEAYNRINIPDYIGWLVYAVAPELHRAAMRQTGLEMIYHKRPDKKACDAYRKVVPFSKLLPYLVGETA